MKTIFRLLIEATQLIAICLWCFYIGTAFGVFMLIVGFVIAMMGGGWDECLGGALWCIGQVVPVLLSWGYKKAYGSDDWFKSETFFGI